MTQLTAAEVTVETTVNLQLRATYTEPAGANAAAKTLLLPDRTGDFMDFFTIWHPPVAATTLPLLRQWY